MSAATRSGLQLRYKRADEMGWIEEVEGSHNRNEGELVDVVMDMAIDKTMVVCTDHPICRNN